MSEKPEIKEPGMPLVIHISSATIAKALLGIVLFLLTIDLLIIYLKFVKGYAHFRGFINGFYFDTEANFPSFYSAMAMLFAAFLLWLIGTLKAEKHKRRSGHWKFLSILFVFLSVDEFASLHEMLIKPVRAIIDQFLPKSDYFYFAWFIPYSLLVLAVGVIFLRFLFTIPFRTRLLFIASGAIFLSGAVGMEMVSGQYWANQGWSIDGKDEVDLAYALMITLEELLEMLGIIVFIYALSAYYLRNQYEKLLHIRIADESH